MIVCAEKKALAERAGITRSVMTTIKTREWTTLKA
jgi:hypothetical protein